VRREKERSGPIGGKGGGGVRGGERGVWPARRKGGGGGGLNTRLGEDGKGRGEGGRGGGIERWDRREGRKG